MLMQFLLFLNPLLMAGGFACIYMVCAENARRKHMMIREVPVETDDDESGPDDDDGSDWDGWDLPLDLPPGVYVPDSDPVHVPA
ncbi:MAG: hypothetical protein OHK0039_37010 [Bacteroidia bacterium]